MTLLVCMKVMLCFCVGRRRQVLRGFNEAPCDTSIGYWRFQIHSINGDRLVIDII